MTVVIVAAQVLKVINSKVLEEVRFAGHVDDAGVAGKYEPVRDSFWLNENLPPDRLATAFVHELAHATGHPKRLARSYIVGAFVGVHQPGVAREAGTLQLDSAYAQEELVAEMASMLVCQQAGVLTPDSIQELADNITVYASRVTAEEFIYATREAVRAQIFLVTGHDAKEAIYRDVSFEEEFGGILRDFVLAASRSGGTSELRGLGGISSGHDLQGGADGQGQGDGDTSVFDSEVALEVSDVSDV